jgi:membrane-associated phospholipid phosphatase
MKNLLSHKVRQAKRWFLDHSLVSGFQEKHPQFSDFWGNRFQTKNFLGLPLTLMVAVAFVNITLLSELTESVMEARWVVVMDKEFTTMLYSIRSPWLSQMLYQITKLGNQEAVFIIGAVVSAIFILRRRFVALIAFWLVMGGIGISVRYGKTFISRARPADVAYYEVEHFSFPSGHATTAFALYGLLAYFLYRHYDKSKNQHFYLWAAFILSVLVGFSRIYLGVHYLSDVLAGFLLGLLWLLLGISLVEVMMYRKNKLPFNNHS